jgi:hypothetical protein
MLKDAIQVAVAHNRERVHNIMMLSLT